MYIRESLAGRGKTGKTSWEKNKDSPRSKSLLAVRVVVRVRVSRLGLRCSVRVLLGLESG